jgi:hypothetical protein
MKMKMMSPCPGEGRGSENEKDFEIGTKSLGFHPVISATQNPIKEKGTGDGNTHSRSYQSFITIFSLSHILE